MEMIISFSGGKQKLGLVVARHKHVRSYSSFDITHA